MTLNKKLCLSEVSWWWWPPRATHGCFQFSQSSMQSCSSKPTQTGGAQQVRAAAPCLPDRGWSRSPWKEKSRKSEGSAPKLQEGSPLLSSCQIFLLLSLYNNKQIDIPSLGLTFRQIPVSQESSMSFGQGMTICVIAYHRKNSKILRGLGWHPEQMPAFSDLKYLLGVLCVLSWALWICRMKKGSFY